MYMKVHEFRKNLKACFDEALSGNTVIVERGGIQYRLVADVTVVGGLYDGSSEPKVMEKPPTSSKPKKVPAVESLLAIPGVTTADKIPVRCKGTHYMSRMDCGKMGCPWGGAK